ncbi:BTAD domain-containing putative transcriptional regulator [Microbispora sp. NPDC049125]|uniref:BTAD domain-containing putative transcriptional regulator n=1 Tax=Microbispora sp. NPDC049125 TaxID=3154929 RepID=UPI003465EF22
MRFGVLGPTEVWTSGDRRIEVGGPRVRALLGLLLLDAGRVVAVPRLIDGLYGEEPPKGAANALQSQVSRLRRMLGDEGAVESHPLGYRISAEPEEVDAHRFERLAVRGREALTRGDSSGAAALLREALDLWRGPALADMGGAPYVRAHAARLEELRISAAEDRMEAELALGRHSALVAELRGLVAAHPLRERLRGHLMRALHGGGRQAEALTAFEETRRTLTDELGADPSAELAALHLAILRGETSAPPPAEARPGVRGRGLPAQLTNLVGREDDVARAGRLLERTRLVTLTGFGGVGKTRLALEVAARHRRSDEVCLVELAPLTDGADVAPAVLGALGLREPVLGPPGPDTAAPDPAERIASAVRDRALLLVLDNCEHVVEDAAHLAHALLSRCPALRVLATAREPLGITGEALYPVPPLELPPPGAATEDARAYPAVRLFAERATAVRPGFAMDAATTPHVERVCRMLDGLPLAMELAAARTRSLPIEEIAARLDDRFALLSRGSRTAQPRHRTLRAVVEWSWDLLDGDERAMARRLSAFAGGIPLEAAGRVSGLPAGEILSSLADRSLVVVGDGHYHMLETIRAFCAERLAESGEEERVRRAHLRCFLDLAEEAEPRLRRAEQLQWLRRLDDEHGNLHAAMRYAVEAGAAEEGIRLVAALSPYWMLRGRRSEAGLLAGELLDRAVPAPAAELADGPAAGLEEEYVQCVLEAAWAGSGCRSLPGHLGAAESIMRRRGTAVRRPFLMLMWGRYAGVSGGAANPSPHLDGWSRALLHLGLGYRHAWVEGDAAAAERELSRALAGFGELGERWGMATALGELATIAGARGDTAGSAGLTEEALGLAGELGAHEDMADLLYRRAEASVGRGDLDAARDDFERGADLGRRAGVPESSARALHGLAEIARARGDLAEARRLCWAALAECPEGWFTAEEIRRRVHVSLDRIAAVEGDAVSAPDA